MKKVVFLKSAPLFPFQGSDISMFERMLLLRAHGWEGTLVSTGQVARRDDFAGILANLHLPASFDPAKLEIRYEHLGSTCRMRLGECADHYAARGPEDVFPLFDDVLGELNPDFCFGNLRDPLVVEYLGALNRPHLMFLTEDEYPRRGQEGFERFAAGLAHVKRIAVASRYMIQSLQQTHGITPELFTNAVATSRYRLEKEAPGQYITLLHPYAHKGVDLFLQLVRAMPERDFLITAGAGAEYRARKSDLLSYPNLVLAGFTRNITDIYRQSRVVLVPSIWQDTCPRVVVEALCSGTPVIASGTGGMRDGGGDAAFYEPVVRYESDPRLFRLDGWMKRIRQLDDATFYTETCERTLRHIAAYEESLFESMSRLAQLMENESQ